MAAPEAAPNETVEKCEFWYFGRKKSFENKGLMYVIRSVLGFFDSLNKDVRHEEARMTESLQVLLSELEHFGEANDRVTTERPRRMLNITRDTGEFLSVLVRATSARRVLEIGTSNGYSTLWLASAVHATGGAVTTVELSDYKVGLAQQNFSRSGLASSITLVQDDAGRVLGRAGDASFDLVFLDSERPEYPGWWHHLKRVLRPADCLWSIMRLLTRRRWHRLWLSSKPTPISRRVSSL